VGSKTNIHTTRKGEHRQLVNAKTGKNAHTHPHQSQKKNGKTGRAEREGKRKEVRGLLHYYTRITASFPG